MTWNNYVFHPALFFSAMRLHPPFGYALLLLIFNSLLFGILTAIGERGHGRRSPTLKKDLHFALWGPLFVMCFAVVASTFVGYCLLLLFHDNRSFEWLFTVFVYAMLPFWIAWFPEYIYNLSSHMHRIQQGTGIVTAIWITALLWIAVQVSSALSWWEVGLVILPICGVIWSTNLTPVCSQPDTLSACYPWKSLSGAFVRVYYPTGKMKEEVWDIVNRSDSIINKAADLMEVELLDFRVGVFLFPDEETHHKYAGTEKLKDRSSAYSHNNCISVVYRKPDVLEFALAHEFAHVLLFQRVSKKCCGLLNEGMACYIEHQLCSNRKEMGSKAKASWRMMSRMSYFYEWRYVEKSEVSAGAAYDYAHSMAGFLIRTYGMKAYLQLCREAATDKEHLSGEQLDLAVKSVYGKSAAEMERTWRSEYNPLQCVLDLNVSRRDEPSA